MQTNTTSTSPDGKYDPTKDPRHLARAAELMREHGFEVPDDPPNDPLALDVERLRKSQQECERDADANGRQTGATWARKRADYAGLRRVAALSLDDVLEDSGAAMTLASATLDDERLSWNEVNEEMERLFETESPSIAEITGFVAGATEVYELI